MKILLVTPPLTQPNTPYPATPFLKGFFDTLGEPCSQQDLGIEVILELLSSRGLRALFAAIEESGCPLGEGEQRMVAMQESYIESIDVAIQFLQGKAQSMAHVIAAGEFLPEGARFDDMDDMEWAFGTMGMHDKARHFVTLYLEDITDLITHTIDADFGFSRYAEQLGRMASSFDELYDRLHTPPTWIDSLMLRLLHSKIEKEQPTVVGITIPFPGNLYSALRCGEYIKANFPHCKVVMGGGFVSTELRSLSDARLFEYTDYLTLDDGERPWQQLLAYWGGDEPRENLVRTFLCEGDEVVYINNNTIADVAPSDTGTPSYEGLPLDSYLSVIEVTNPMHSLWSNGRWNKLMLAHGCYWGKCAFCDGSLDYIGRYKPNKAVQLVDSMEQLIAETGERGFHFVDEAAPPTLLKELALEILHRKLAVTWWTNVRFEKSYTADLCTLLKRSGCIAVSGGIEVASDRLLKLINKGVSVAQVARVTNHFTEAGIMVHGYLMYGFPTETAQETIDSLEVVRQLFEEGLVQSGFWHRFALTAHSPVGCNPTAYHVEVTEPPFGGFARNDMQFIDTVGDDPSPYGEGLRRSLFNYMRGVGFDLALGKWFDTPVPRTLLPPNYIARCLENEPTDEEALQRKRIYWLGGMPRVEEVVRAKKGKSRTQLSFTFELRQGSLRFTTPLGCGTWLLEILPTLMVEGIAYKECATLYRKAVAEGGALQTAPFWEPMREGGLVVV